MNRPRFPPLSTAIGGSLLTALSLLSGAAAAQPPASNIADRAAQALIRQLDSERFADRQEASRRLREMGEEAYPALAHAASSPSPEVRARSAWILRDSQERVIRAAFTDLSRQPDNRLDVEHGMWLIARILNAGVRRADLTRQLDDLAQRVRTKLGPSIDPRRCDPQVAMTALRDVLFVDEKLAGAISDYNNPDNSSLERVLAKRRGLPIVLSHIVVAVADRLGIPVVGVPLPGRYLVKYDGARAPDGFPRDDRFMDPFDGGHIYQDVAELRQLFPGLDPEDIPRPSSNRAILVRMMNNLESHLYQSGNVAKAELVVVCKVILQEGLSPEE